METKNEFQELLDRLLKEQEEKTYQAVPKRKSKRWPLSMNKEKKSGHHYLRLKPMS